nr:uncharacterized protein LOC109165865 [Ipomoea batatas]
MGLLEKVFFLLRDNYMGILRTRMVIVRRRIFAVFIKVQRSKCLLYNEQKVKVDAVGSNRLVVKVRCLKGEGLLVRILEAMEEMNLRVLQARVSSQLFFFAMDAILEAHQNHFSADAITQAILKAIDQKSYEIKPTNNCKVHRPHC